MYQKWYMGDSPLIKGLNYKQLTSHNPKIIGICRTGRRTHRTNCTAAQ